MIKDNPLAPRMRALADSGHTRATELRELADKFELAATGFYSDPQTVSVKVMMGTWARARRLWCDCTGEPLI